MYARRLWGAPGKVYVNLMVGSEVAASAVIDSLTEEWVKYELKLTSSLTANEGVSLLTKKPSAEITEEFEKAKAYTE